MEGIWRLSATDVAAAVKSKKVSAKEVATAALARLDAVNPAINAVVDHRPEDVLAQAAAVDAAIARGEALGPLAGVPVTIKANIDQAGYATTNGLKLQRDHIARENGPVTIVFNGDFHWFDTEPAWFAEIERGVARHHVLRGNVETEIARASDIGAGCGCASRKRRCAHRSRMAKARCRRCRSSPKNNSSR